VLKSAAAEHAARMTAMDSATRNAREVINKLWGNPVRRTKRRHLSAESGAAA
jgi:F0F1-type ATP synthase gamma subunit